MKHANVAIFVPHIGCPNRCSFCNQNSISGQQAAPSPEDAAAVCRQAIADLGENAPMAQAAFFGGSFTAIPREYMLALLRAVQPYIGPGKLSGIRLSTRPDAISRQVLDLLVQHKVTAIELGVQSMDNAVLAANYRGHTAKDVENACALIRQYPIELGLQMMVGLQGETEGSLRYTAEKIADLLPDTLRIYPTLVIKGTQLARWYQEGLYTPLSLQQAVEQCAFLLEFFGGRQIPVIRLGLHASTFLEGDILAGPYHPAFRELCENKIYLNHAFELLTNMPKEKKYHLLAGPAFLSKAVGQNKKNIEALRQAGYNVQVKPKPGLALYQLKVEEAQ